MKNGISISAFGPTLSEQVEGVDPKYDELIKSVLKLFVIGALTSAEKQKCIQRLINRALKDKDNKKC